MLARMQRKWITAMEKTGKFKKKKNKSCNYHTMQQLHDQVFISEKKRLLFTHKKTYTNVIAALFIIAKNWKCA